MLSEYAHTIQLQKNAQAVTDKYTWYILAMITVLLVTSVVFILSSEHQGAYLGPHPAMLIQHLVQCSRVHAAPPATVTS